MTPSPGKIKEVIEVPFSRPRCRSSLVAGQEYVSLRSRLLSLLHEEMFGEISKQEKEMKQLI
jgi:NitT/TauT family transport system ATP-binding protein